MQVENDVYRVGFTKKQLYIVGGIILALIGLGLGLTGWGIARQAAMVQLRQQTQLQSEQLKLLTTKTDTLDKKLQFLDSLDQELRQMVKGTESGQGTQTDKGGDAADNPQSPSDDDSSVEILTPTQLSAKLSKLDMQVQKRLISFYTLRNILKDGVGADIASLSAVNFATGTPNSAGSTTPSIWPAHGVITSSFGSRTDPVYGGGAFHAGVDIADDYGTQVVATAAGVVTFAGPTDGGYGNLVEIDHGNGIVTRYGHNEAVLVSAGQRVNQGQAISLMGSTGKSTGPHVHYEVDVNGSPVDPLVFLPMQNN